MELHIEIDGFVTLEEDRTFLVFFQYSEGLNGVWVDLLRLNLEGTETRGKIR
jgi:hypothetical protein